MNILLISPLPPPSGGIASWTKRYIEYNDLLKQHKMELVNIAVIGNRIRNSQKIFFIEELKRTTKILFDLFTKTRSHNIDVVHLNSACGRMGIIRDYLCVMIVKINKIPLLTHFRCDVSFMVKDKFSLFLLKEIVKNSKKIISLNSVSFDFIQRNCKTDSIIMPNFLPNDYINITKRNKYIGEKIERIIYVGHITKSKGCDLIVELAKRMPTYQFIMVGSVKEDMKKIPLTENTQIIDEIPPDEVVEELDKADLFLFPSLTEGFPNAVAEAMACGLPIIATPVGAIPEMLEDKGGLLVDVNDTKGFEKAILQLADCPDTRAAMSRWNQLKVAREYCIDKIYQDLIDTYKQMQDKTDS